MVVDHLFTQTKVHCSHCRGGSCSVTCRIPGCEVKIIEAGGDKWLHATQHVSGIGEGQRNEVLVHSVRTPAPKDDTVSSIVGLCACVEAARRYMRVKGSAGN